jgi:hypothetical protein
MKKCEAVAYFGSQAALAAALKIKAPSVAEWGEYPPPLRQMQIQELSGGALKAESDCVPSAPPNGAQEAAA